MKRGTVENARPAPSRRWRRGEWQEAAAPASPEEMPVAIVINGSSQAVLMATPDDLQDFATGFALTEGIIGAPDDVTGFEAVELDTAGGPAREARLWLAPGVSARHLERRRSMLGPVGCGLCGIDSIDAALPAIRQVASGWRMAASDVPRAIARLNAAQIKWRETPAIHAAGWWCGETFVLREDVGRHNALDKLAGALARQKADGARGAVVLSSRLSVDLVQKTARIGAPVLIGAGAPTRLALRWAEAARITLIGRAHDEGFDLYTHPDRIEG